MRIGSLILLVLLTLTVAAYNYQYFNIPSSMILNAYSLIQERTTEFRITLPSTGIAHEYRNVTDDGSFRGQALEYVIAGDTVRYPIQVPEYSSAEWWLKHTSNYSEYDMTIEFFDDYYFLQVRYEPTFHRTSSEYTILLAINAVTAIAWVLFAFALWKPLAKRNERIDGE